ncbi:MAG: hypothetical protein JNN03_22660 [Rubrivivax sp.]|nr:hypothetical protein [Rubrivivax sp.]
MSAIPASIRRSDKAARAVGFERLLAQGLQQLQQLSGESWTDHNLHDPGITVLEQLCFALTELAYRADLPITDHLAAPDGSIDLQALALHPPETALPCRATTVADYRRLFLDRVPGLDDARMRPASAASEAGVYRLQLKVASGTPFSPASVDDSSENPARRLDALRVYRAERNLCEDLVEVGFVQGRRCDLRGDIEISGAREVVEILADIYHRAARWIDRGPQVLSRQEMLARHCTMDAVYDGPAVQAGFVQDEGRDERLDGRLYLADLADVLRGVDGVKEVHDLALDLAAPARAGPGRGSVAWGGLDWALRLHIPRAADEFRLGARRRELPVPLPRADELWRRVRNLRVADLAQRTRLESALRKEEWDARPRGTHRPLAPHLSVQHHFPAVYALGKQALPASATAQRRARVQQLRAYLSMFDQLLANGNAQLHHLRDLYAVRGKGSSSVAAAAPGAGAMPSAGVPAMQPDEDATEAGGQTYWWQALDPEGVPGIDELLMQSPGQVASEIGAFFDRSGARKSRLLDHLLALHGETLTQSALRQYCAHLRADELDRRLLDNKARFVEAIIELGRGRAGAFDYSRRLWNNPANSCGLARRMCLLLGFKHDHARSLTQWPGRGPSPVFDGSDAASPPGLAKMPKDASFVNVVDEPGVRVGSPQAMLSQLAAQLPRLPRPAPAAMLRAGASHEGYRVHTVSEGGASPVRTTVGVALDADQWWPLGHADTRADARRLAARLRQAFLCLDDACEGLHLVEHVLLRPLDTRANRDAQLSPAPDENFYRLQLTVLMPNWTARTANKAFQQLAEETLRLNLPAHLQARPIRWLGYEAMVHFERDWRRWLVLRQRWCRAPTPACARSLDAAACRVIGRLLEPPSASGARSE